MTLNSIKQHNLCKMSQQETPSSRNCGLTSLYCSRLVSPCASVFDCWAEEEEKTICDSRLRASSVWWCRSAWSHGVNLSSSSTKRSASLWINNYEGGREERTKGMGGKGEKWIMERKKKLKGLATKENKGSERRQQVKQTKRKRDGENKDVIVENRRKKI